LHEPRTAASCRPPTITYLLLATTRERSKSIQT